MDNKLVQLQQMGCDIDGAMRRFMNNEALYLKFFNTLFDDPAYKSLGDSLAAADVNGAFEHAHCIKGIVGNMGLTPLYNVICALVDILRKGSLEGTDALYADVIREVERFRNI